MMRAITVVLEVVAFAAAIILFKIGEAQ